MSLSLTDSKYIVFNNCVVITGNRLIDFAEKIDAVQGLAQDTLSRLDANYFQTVATANGNKAEHDLH